MQDTRFATPADAAQQNHRRIKGGRAWRLLGGRREAAGGRPQFAHLFIDAPMGDTIFVLEGSTIADFFIFFMEGSTIADFLNFVLWGSPIVIF